MLAAAMALVPLNFAAGPAGALNPPTVTALSPTAGATSGGTSVTITGTNFVSGATVKFGSVAATSVTFNSSTSITATSPAESAGSVDVTVTTSGGTSATGTGDLFAFGAPTVSSISPNSGPTSGGQSVTISGTGFSPGISVLFDLSGSCSSVVLNSGTSLSCVTPALAANSYPVIADNAVGGSNTNVVYAFGAPKVTGVSPNGGSIGGGTSVTVTGTSFAPGVTVRFGTVAAINVVVNSGTSLTVVSPAGSIGAVDVTVTNSQGTSPTGIADQFVYTSPAVNSVMPDAGPVTGGTSVTILGFGFAPGATVKFGTVAASSVVVKSANAITAKAPAGTAGSVDVTVTTAAGTSPSSSSDLFAYGAPTVTGVSPDTGPNSGGTSVTVSGTGFAQGAQVDFGNGTATVTSVNATGTSLIATSPSGHDSVDVTVVTGAGRSATSGSDTFGYDAPNVTAVSPNAGPTAGGTAVAVVGTGFVANPTVKFGTTPATSATTVSPTLILAVAPAETAATVDVQVSTPQGTSPSNISDQFTFGSLTVTQVSPSGGPTSGGTSVTITGTGFASGATVDFGTTAASSVSVNSATSITVASPAHAAGSVDVTVTVGATASPVSASDLFSYGAPTVTSVTPNQGPTAGGTTVTVSGSGFVPGEAVHFGSTAGTNLVVLSGGTLLVTAPSEAAATIDVTVVNSAPGTGTSATSAADQFTYVAAPTVTAVSPNGGPAAGGTTVTVTGSGFVNGATTVDFGVAASTNVTVNSSTSLTAISPAGSGAVDITVTTAGGTSPTSATDLFGYGSPTVTALTPNGGPVGGGQVVTVTGTGFANGASASFGATPATGVTVLSGTELTAIAPARASGSVDVTVTTSGGTSSTSTADLFAYGSATVASVSPEAGPLGGGQTVTVTGSGFATNSIVLFGTTPATGVTVNATGTSLTATSPTGGGLVDVYVVTSGGASTPSIVDHYIYGIPTVSSISPVTGPPSGGTTVVVNGSNFTQDASIKFGPATATVTNVASNGTFAIAHSPAGTGSVDVRVSTAAGTSAASINDLFAYSAPIVSAVSPQAGSVSGGTSVTVSGTGFIPGARVSFGSTASTSVTVNSGTQLTAVSPSHASGQVDITVTTSLGTSPTSAADVFLYGSPAVTAVSPVTGPTTGGTAVTITGTGFTSDATVKFGSTAASSVTFVSTTSLTAVSPPEPPGVVDVTVTTGGGTSSTSSADEFAYGNQLELSCGSPPYSSATTACSGINLPSLTNDGMEQATQSQGNVVYITDNRNDRSAGWSVSAYMVGTAGAPSPGCLGYTGFCNWTVGATSTNPNGRVSPSHFSVGSVTCATAPGNNNPEPHVGAGGQFPTTGPGAVALCNADPGSSSGTFKLGATYSLAMPESALAGTYHATVEYLVM